MQFENTITQLAASPARPDRPAAGAEFAAVLLDQRGVSAFLAVLAGQRHRSGGLAFLLRHIHHTHVRNRVAIFIIRSSFFFLPNQDQD